MRLGKFVDHLNCNDTLVAAAGKTCLELGCGTGLVGIHAVRSVRVILRIRCWNASAARVFTSTPFCTHVARSMRVKRPVPECLNICTVCELTSTLYAVCITRWYVAVMSAGMLQTSRRALLKTSQLAPMRCNVSTYASIVT